MSRLRNCLLAYISLLLCSCAKSPFSNGPIQQETRRLNGVFRVLEINDDVDVELRHQQTATHDTITKVALMANANLIDKLITEIHGDTLTISNNNSLDWVRPYDATIKATVYYDTINTLIFNSNGRLRSDTIRSTNPNFCLQVEGGSGDIDLNIDCERFHTEYDWGTATVKLRGRTGLAYTSASYNCHGPIDAQELETTYHYIYCYGTNRIIAKAFTEINAINGNNGVVCYVRYHTLKQETVWGHYDENHVWIPAYEVMVDHSCPKRIIYQGPSPDDNTGLDSIVIQ